MGRPSKYNEANAKKITDAVRVGATYKLACSYAGISDETFANWRKRYPEFEQALVEAEGGAVVKWLALIDKAAQDGTWQAAAWKLERRYPREYGRTVIEHDGKVEVYEVKIGRSDTPDNT